MAINKFQRSRLTFNFSAKVAHIGSPINTVCYTFKHSFLRPIELKFHMKIPYDRLAKIYTNCTGHMTKMATMPIYGKNPLNILFSGTKRPMALVCSIGHVGPTMFAQMMNLGWPWPTLWQGQIWFLMHLYGENITV